MMMLTTTISKINDKLYEYAPLSITIFYMNIFYPILILIYLKMYKIKDLFKLTKKELINILIAGITYNVELVILYWCLLYVPLGFYMVGRTSSAFFNILFAKYYIHKPIDKLYYVGLILLLSSYILFLVGLRDKDNLNNNYKQILSIIVVFITGLTTSIYNNMGEKYFMTQENNLKNKLIYQVFFNLFGFIIIMPIFLSISIKNNDFISNIGPTILYIITGLCSQLYILVKLYILASKTISGSQLLTGAELLRRVITNVIAYTWFGEYYNILIICANIIMFCGSYFIIKGSLNTTNKNSDDEEDAEELEKIIIIENINEIYDEDINRESDKLL